MLNNLSIAQPNIDRLTILNSGTITLIEDLYRDEFVLDRSRVKVTVASVQVSGVISRLYYEIYGGDLKADNVITFITAPSGTELIEIAGTKYRFANSLSGINDVPRKNTALGNAVALYRVLNIAGLSGADYYSGQNANIYVSGLLADNPLYIQVRVSGIIGNTYTIRRQASSSAIKIYNWKFTKGMVQDLTDAIQYGYVAYSGVNGTTYLPEVPSSDYGNIYYVRLYFANNSGLQALNTAQQLSDYWLYTPTFYGRTSLPYYAEVSGLIGSDLVGGKIPSIGELSLNWRDMIAFSGITAMLASPTTSGTPTQSTDYYDMIELGQKFHYIVFVFKSAAGSSPQRSWPRPQDNNGTWYYAGRTEKIFTKVIMPFGTTYSVWVGFGNAGTLQTSGLPFDVVHPQIYLE